MPFVGTNKLHIRFVHVFYCVFNFILFFIMILYFNVIEFHTMFSMVHIVSRLMNVQC